MYEQKINKYKYAVSNYLECCLWKVCMWSESHMSELYANLMKMKIFLQSMIIAEEDTKISQTVLLLAIDVYPLPDTTDYWLMSLFIISFEYR